MHRIHGLLQVAVLLVACSADPTCVEETKVREFSCRFLNECDGVLPGGALQQESYVRAVVSR
jgi:hypothetical protein